MPSQPSERVTIAAIAGPQTIANVPVVTGGIDMSRFQEAMFILEMGTMAAETMDFKLQASATAGGVYTDVPGKAIAQIPAGSTNNKQAIINLKAEKMPTGTQFVRGSAVTGGALGGPASITALGLEPRYGPASDDKLASVVQIVI